MTIRAALDGFSLSFDSRSGLVAWWAANLSTPPKVGTVFTADGLSYRYTGIGAAISDLPGWVPHHSDQVYVEHFRAISYLTQAAAEAGVSSSASFQAAHDYLAANNLAGTVKVLGNAFRLEDVVTVSTLSSGFEGVGMLETVLVVTGPGAGLRYTRDNPTLRRVSVVSGATRAALTFAAAGERCGIRLECEDAVDTSSLRVRWADFQIVKVSGHPWHGIVCVGAFTGFFNQCIVQSNKGAGYAIATDVSPRLNESEVPGLCVILGGVISANGGNGIDTGPLTDTSTPACRFNIMNVEIGGNALDVLARRWPSELYLRASQVSIETCVFKPNVGNTEIEGWYISGIGGRIINNRYIRCKRAGTISSHTALQTNNIVVDGIHMLEHPGTYDPLVLVRTEGANEPYGITVRGWSGGVLGSLVKTDATMGSAGPQRIYGMQASSAPLVFVKSASQIVNNTTTMVDVADLEMRVRANETIVFECTLAYMADIAADLRARMIGPTGSVVTFNVPSSGKVGTGDTYTVQSNVDQTSQIVVGAGGIAVERMLTLTGTCVNGSTEGRLRAQFAQSAAGINDATIVAGRSFVKFYRVMS